jgi:hypothetical protein
MRVIRSLLIVLGEEPPPCARVVRRRSIFRKRSAREARKSGAIFKSGAKYKRGFSRAMNFFIRGAAQTLW